MEISPLFSTVRVLRPFPGFEAVYQGRAADIPIAFPGTLDLEAGATDYDPLLITGVSVPMGARVVLWIPLTVTPDTEGALLTTLYRYQILWRLRNISEMNDSVSLPPDQQKLYSLPTRELGVPDVPGTPRVILPCAMETVAYEQTEPGGSFANGSVDLRGVFVIPDGNLQSPMPLMPLPATGRGSFGQGTFPSSSGAPPGGPVYMVYETVASGNEIGILARRLDAPGGTSWDFTSNTEDRPFSNTYGTDNGNHPEIPGLGILLITGSP